MQREQERGRKRERHSFFAGDLSVGSENMCLCLRTPCARALGMTASPTSAVRKIPTRSWGYVTSCVLFEAVAKWSLLCLVWQHPSAHLLGCTLCILLPVNTWNVSRIGCCSEANARQQARASEHLHHGCVRTGLLQTRLLAGLGVP